MSPLNAYSGGMDHRRFAESPVGQLVAISGQDARFGQSYEHYAFVPTALSDEPTLCAETWHEVAAASRTLARLDRGAFNLPNPHLLRRPTLRREAHSTSALEGTFAPMEAVLAATEGEQMGHELREVLDYVTAAEFAFDAQAESPLTVGLLEEAHRLLMQHPRGRTHPDVGRIRTCQVAIGSPSGRIEDARFVPIPPGADLQEQVRGLLAWMSQVPQKSIDPIVAAAMAHYQFEALHPFHDGNGRLGRLLVVLQLMRMGLLSEPLLTISPWLDERRALYHDGLSAVSQTGQWDTWVHFFAQCLRHSAEDSTQRMDRLVAVRDAYRRLLDAHSITGVAEELTDLLVAYPMITAPEAAQHTGRTRAGVGKAFERLANVGIVAASPETYRRRFIAVDVLDAVTAPNGQVPHVDLPLRCQR